MIDVTEMKNNRELMENIFVQAILDDAEGYIADSSAEVIFSEKHQMQMKHILRSSKHWYWSVISSAKRRIAVALIAAALLLLVGCSAYVWRDAITGFIYEVYDRYFSVTVEPPSDETAHDSIETEYTLTYLPDGYELADYKLKTHVCQTIWRDRSGNDIVFNQSISNGGVWQIGDQYDTLETKAVGEHQITIFSGDDCADRIYIWVDGYYDYTLHCPIALDESEAEEMIMSVKAK